MLPYILYLTKKCNLHCSYCYERDQHIDESLSYEEINLFLERIFSANDINNTICFFGGEPFLEFPKIQYIVNRCHELHKFRPQKNFSFSTITNGTLIHKYIPEIRNLVNDPVFNFMIFVSYDGSNQFLRTGKKKIVEKNLELLVKEKIPFGVSYTVHSQEIKPLLIDLFLIIKKYHPKQIRLNFNCSSMFPNDITELELYKDKLTDYLNYIYMKYGVPFCFLVCELCGQCHYDPKQKNPVVDIVSNENSLSFFVKHAEKKKFNLFKKEKN